MASNQYYDSRPQRPQYQAWSSNVSSYSQNYNHDNELPPLPPPNSSKPPSKPPSYRTSPFEGPFDDERDRDNIYAARPQDSQISFGQDTSYHSQTGAARPYDSTNSFRDDIPLQNQGKKDQETDHVYDASDALPLSNGRGSEKPRGFARLFSKEGGRTAWVVYILTTIQVAVFIAEIVKNAQITGSPIMIHPTFNPMIGPSSQVLINLGARYVSCMHPIVGVTDVVTEWPCPSTTTTNVDDPNNQCSLGQLCGFGANIDTFKDNPNQWFRFITPIFLHAGIIHIGFNMLLQVTLGREMEKAIGPIRFLLVYFSSGIFGFVMGGNFAAQGIASTGASGALFGIIALTLLDLLYTWKERTSPWKDLAFIGLDVVVSFILGLLPGLDNFSHIGGFLMGIVLGICILHSPSALRKRIDQDTPPYATVSRTTPAHGATSGFSTFVKSPVAFFKGRKGLWWVWWLVRAAALLVVVIVFIVLLRNFYVFRKTCSWCKYLSCLPINNWCEIGNLNITNTKRDLDNLKDMARLYEAALALN